MQRKNPQKFPGWPPTPPRPVVEVASILRRISMFSIVNGLFHHPAPSMAIFAPKKLSWAVLGPSWAVLGPSWAVLGPSWGHLGPFWGHHGPSWGHLFSFFRVHFLEPCLLRKRYYLQGKPNILMSIWGPKRGSSGVFFFIFFGVPGLWLCDEHLGVILGSSWAVLGPSWAVLGPSWAVLGLS